MESLVPAILILVVEVEVTARTGLGRWQGNSGIEICPDGGMPGIGLMLLKGMAL
jgi:hypothetical protein